MQTTSTPALSRVPLGERDRVIEQLVEYFGEHYDRYFDEMIDAIRDLSAADERGEAIECMRDVVHRISDTFLDPRSPSHFTLANSKGHSLRLFAAFLAEQLQTVGTIRDVFASKRSLIPWSVERAYAVIQEVIAVLQRAFESAAAPVERAEGTA